MSDIDDLEAMVEQFRFGVNEPKRGFTKKARRFFDRARRHGGKENRSIAKQQFRSSDRRGVVAIRTESGANGGGEVPIELDEDQVEAV